MKKLTCTLTALCLLLLVDSAHATDIPVDTWIAIRNATNLTGAGLTATLYEKHMTVAYSPKMRRFYITGGDTHKHFIGPGGVDLGASSYYQGTHSLDLNVRLASPGQVNAGTRLEYPYCSSGSALQPKRPDFVGFQWAPWLDRFVLVPGEFVPSTTAAANCPGEDSVYADNPNYAFRKIMSFDPVTNRWGVMSANHGALYTGSDYPWHTYADPLTKRLIRLENNGDLVADHYDPATDTWAYYRSNGNGLNCSKSHLGAIDRTLYCADRERGLFGAYNIDTHAVTVVGPLPGDPWCCVSVPADKGYIFAVPSARKIVYAEFVGATWAYRIWAWSPDAPSWVRIDTLPWKTLDGEALPPGEMPRGTGGAVDTDLGILYLTGEYGGTAKYSWVIALSPSGGPQIPPVTPLPVTPPPVTSPPVKPQPATPPPAAPAPAAQKPTLKSISPSPVASGSGGVNLVVTGSGFVSGLKATVGGQARAVSFGSATQVTIGVLAADVVKVGNVAVQVINPGTCGTPGTSTSVCVSNTMQLAVAQPAPAPQPASAPQPKITIQVTPPECVDVTVNGVLISGSCPPNAARLR